jgi:hypothetical protein
MTPRTHDTKPAKHTRSQIADYLGPDGDHTDKQRQGREGGGFLQDGLEHGFLPRT